MSATVPAPMSEREHALLSASASHRWLHCPPSARLEETFPERTSADAEAGRLAHKIAELKLRKHFTPMGPRTYNKAIKELQADPPYQPEMLEHTDTYLEYVQQACHAYTTPPHVAIERRLDYANYAPEGFGTGDCLIIGGGLLHVIDFKYGAGVPVAAQENPQMMLYALGALNAYGMLYDVERIRMTIVQPRLDAAPEYELSAAELCSWGNRIRPVAQQAFAGEGEYCAGEWCQFCRAKAQCRARNEEYSATVTALEAFAKARPPLITNEELAGILRRAQPIAAWVEDLREYALTALLRGELVPGWKAVEGRSNRKFADTDAAFKRVMEEGYDERVLYTREPITLTAVEKLLGKKLFGELLESYIIKPPGKPTLAPETDNREPITLNPTAAEVFGQPA